LKRKGVPPNTPIILDVEMVHFDGGEKKKTLADMSPAERFEQAKSCKETGNSLFKELKYQKAMSQYSQCIQYLAHVYYKPSAKLSDPVVTPVTKPIPEDMENVLEDSKDEDASASREQTDEEGFQEARILGEGVRQVVSNSTNQHGDGDEEAVETIDVSTGSAVEAIAEPVERPEDQSTKQTTDVNTGDKSQEEDKQPGSPATPEATDTGEPDGDDPEEKEVLSLHVTTLNNMSLCFVKLEDYKRAVESASIALRMDPESFKALYYRYVYFAVSQALAPVMCCRSA